MSTTLYEYKVATAKKVPNTTRAAIDAPYFARGAMSLSRRLETKGVVCPILHLRVAGLHQNKSCDGRPGAARIDYMVTAVQEQQDLEGSSMCEAPLGLYHQGYAIIMLLAMLLVAHVGEFGPGTRPIG